VMDAKISSDIARAEEILSALPDDASEAVLNDAAEKALAISPYCLGAWQILAELAETEEEAIVLLKKGGDHGRQLHASLIHSVDTEGDLWGHVEARDFIRLLHSLAMFYDATDELEQAVEIYEEILHLNPSDNQGVRSELLHDYIVLNQTTEARALLKRFENIVETDTSLAYGNALLEIMIAMEDFEDEWMDEIERQQPSDISGFKKFFGKNFPVVDKAMKSAMKANPYVGLIMTMPGIMEMEEPTMVSMGGPDEALLYAHKHAPTWLAAFLPFVMVSTYALNANDNGSDPSPDHLEELEAISDFATDPDFTPWWEDVIE
jgi:tetratricopeptide (TPR) repeat protein